MIQRLSASKCLIAVGAIIRRQELERPRESWTHRESRRRGGTRI